MVSKLFTNANPWPLVSKLYSLSILKGPSWLFWDGRVHVHQVRLEQTPGVPDQRLAA